jgi:hypothetical protein
MRSAVGIDDSSGERTHRCQGYVSLDHPLWRVRSAIDAPLGALQPWLRSTITQSLRCPISPEQMVRALLLQFLFSIRRDRQLVDQILYSMLFRWFVGIRADGPRWDPEVFATYRQQLLKHEVVRELLLRGLLEANVQGLLSAEALTARRCELAQFASEEVTVGVGQPGVLPRRSRQPTTPHQITASDAPA